MAGRRLLPIAAAFVAAAVGCGDRYGDPIILVLPDESGASGAGDAPDARDAGGTGGGSPGGGVASIGGGGASASGGSAPSVGIPLGSGPIGLCGGCSASDECGDANDACIRHADQRFCGRDCFDARDCPDGYACVELTNSRLYQCVPETTCPEPAAAPPSLDELRSYMLERINAERVARNHAPLQASACLDQLAQESALSFAATDEPLGKFVKECDPIWPNCACGWTAEAETAIARYGLDWMTAADHALGVGRDTQNDRFVRAYRDYDASDVGVGFWISGDEAWIALSFR